MLKHNVEITASRRISYPLYLVRHWQIPHSLPAPRIPGNICMYSTSNDFQHLHYINLGNQSTCCCVTVGAFRLLLCVLVIGQYILQIEKCAIHGRKGVCNTEMWIRVCMLMMGWVSFARMRISKRIKWVPIPMIMIMIMISYCVTVRAFRLLLCVLVIGQYILQIEKRVLHGRKGVCNTRMWIRGCMLMLGWVSFVRMRISKWIKCVSIRMIMIMIMISYILWNFTHADSVILTLTG